jgi:hypothetical protein
MVLPRLDSHTRFVQVCSSARLSFTLSHAAPFHCLCSRSHGNVSVQVYNGSGAYEPHNKQASTLRFVEHLKKAYFAQPSSRPPPPSLGCSTPVELWSIRILQAISRSFMRMGVRCVCMYEHTDIGACIRARDMGACMHACIRAYRYGTCMYVCIRPYRYGCMHMCII